MKTTKNCPKSEKREAAAKNSSLQNLDSANALIIKQHKELGEILTGCR
jgi:hypothetical protein